MSRPGMGGAEMHGLGDELPDPLDGGGNGTGPDQFEPAPDRAEPVTSDPEQAMRAVQQGQPGTWPTSVLDLADGPPEPVTESVPAWLREPVAGPEPDPDAVSAGEKGVTTPMPGRAGGNAFEAHVQIDPIADTGSFELRVSGPAAFVSSIVEQFASSFLYQTQNDRD